MKRDLHKLIEQVVARGWEVAKTSGGHLRWKHPSGSIVFTSSTPSDRRALKNIETHLRRVERQNEQGAA